MFGEIREEEGFETQLGRLFWSVLRPKMGITSPCSSENLQKTTSLYLLEMLPKHLNILKFLSVQNINFILKKYEQKNIFLEPISEQKMPQINRE